ncbi:MAG: sortase [Clostridia bacterium]|nr:sortase [Clostridia bacterium]
MQIIYFGIIQIPKIDLYYPVFSHLTEELLKSSPCKFYGDTPSVNGNICIAGHNYDNRLFFSKLSSLSSNDIIYIFDNNGFKYVYSVYNIYEVPSSDLSPVLNYEQNEKILTLVTCNNFNNNRIIVRAKQK